MRADFLSDDAYGGQPTVLLNNPHSAWADRECERTAWRLLGSYPTSSWAEHCPHRHNETPPLQCVRKFP